MCGYDCIEVDYGHYSRALLIFPIELLGLLVRENVQDTMFNWGLGIHYEQ